MGCVGLVHLRARRVEHVLDDLIEAWHDRHRAERNVGRRYELHDEIKVTVADCAAGFAASKRKPFPVAEPSLMLLTVAAI